VTAARIQPVNRNSDRLVWYLLWRGGRWYLRRRLPSTRRLVLAGLASVSALVVAALLARRLGS
jgi:hypothetical protein